MKNFFKFFQKQNQKNNSSFLQIKESFAEKKAFEKHPSFHFEEKNSTGRKKIFTFIQQPALHLIKKTHIFYHQTKKKFINVPTEEVPLSNKGVIFVLSILIWIIADWFYSFTQYFEKLSFFNPFGLLCAFFGLIVMGFLGYFVYNDIAGIITIHKQYDFRQKVTHAILTNNMIVLKETLLTYPLITHQLKERIKNEWGTSLELNKILTVYNKLVLNKIDIKIDKVIKKYAVLSAGANALSTKAWFDFIITVYFYSKVIVEMARIYHIKIGICSFFRLISLGIMGSSVTAVLQNVIIESTKSVVVVGKITEATINATIVYKLGHRVKSAIRPVNPKFKG